jgi:hypothetical protein
MKPGMMLQSVFASFSWNRRYSSQVTQNDMIMWLMSEAKGVEKSVDALARRFLLVNLSAVQPTSLVSSVVMRLVPTHAWGRRSCGYCTAFSPTLNIWNLSAKTLKLPWRREVGRELDWTRCASSIASYGRPNALTQRASVR